MTPIPLRHRVLVTVEPPPPSSSLILRPSNPSVLVHATVVSCGEEVTLVQPGDRVLCNPLLGQTVDTWLLLPQTAVVATL